MQRPSDTLSRRTLLRAGVGSSLGLLATALTAGRGWAAPTPGLGPLEMSAGGLLSLPGGFRYVVLQRAGDPMSDGHLVPAQPDGMACFQDAQGRLVLLRNHELGDVGFLRRQNPPLTAAAGEVVPTPRYRDGVYGGVSRVVLDPKRLRQDLAKAAGERSGAVERSHLVLAGTDLNCAGGVVQGGWVSCEESSRLHHGYAFFTRPDDEQLVAPRRITSWGRFQREAVAHDPRSGVVYMTEDHPDAVLYRFVPERADQPMGAGTLEALAVDGLSHTHPYTHAPGGTPPPARWPDGQSWQARWVRVPDPQARETPCRVQATALGATRFCGTEGVTLDADGVWFVTSTGGRSHGGQIFRYRPEAAGRGRLTLAHEVGDRRVLSCPDNVIVTPWGELLLAEDNYERGGVVTHQCLRLMRRDGAIYDLARNEENRLMRESPGSEFTGICFSPDGRFLFVNLQAPTQMTLVITGPWPKA